MNCVYCKIEMQTLDEMSIYCPECGFIKRSESCPECKIQLGITICETYLCCSRCGIIFPRYFPHTAEEDKPVFDPKKHFLMWLDRILGRTAPKENIIPNIQGYIAKNNITEISPEDLRKILKKLKLTKYYNYTSYLFAELTGVGTPNIPDFYIHKANILFQNYIKKRKLMFDKQNFAGPNNPSYQYLIYKIFDEILPIEDTKNRCILGFIHLPGQATLLKRDKEWDFIWNQCLETN